jgi:DNA-binding PadR family transcriptional regulator
MTAEEIPPFPMLMKALVGKGDFKILVLSVLQQRPMHGYEITKVIQEQSHGFYRPSAGSIYPALQALLRKGMVKVSSEERRKIYQITPAGKRLIQDKHAEIDCFIESFKKSMGPERAALMDEMGKTGKLLALAGKSITPEQAKELSEVMSDARERILRILSE